MRSGENKSKLEKMTVEAWHPQHDSRPAPMVMAMPRVLGEAAQRQLGLKGRGLEVPWGAVQDRVSAAISLDQQGLNLPGSVLDDLRLLTAKSGRDQVPSPDFGKAIKLIPALSLEWARAGSMIPELVGCDPVTGGQASQRSVATVTEAFENLDKQWRDHAKESLRVLAPIARLVGAGGQVSQAAAGVAGPNPQVHPVMALAGTTVQGAGVVGAVAAGFVAAAGAATITIGVVNSNNRARLSSVQQAIVRLASDELNCRLTAFDDLMDTAREILDQELRRLYRIDERAGRRDAVRMLIQRTRSQCADLMAATGENILALG
jgi:hypothetical protein